MKSLHKTILISLFALVFWCGCDGDTPDSCLENNNVKNGVCEGCLIDDVCYPDKVINPDEKCKVCHAEHNSTGWSNNDGATCDDGVYCNGIDICQSGSCSLHNDSPCESDAHCVEEERLCCKNHALLSCHEQQRVVWFDSCGEVYELVEECDTDTSYCINGGCKCQPGYYDLDLLEVGCEYFCQSTYYEPVSIVDSSSDYVADANCDGIEGDISKAIFVAPNPLGNDVTGDGTFASPFESLPKAISVAIELKKFQILIARGEYIIEQPLEISNIGLYGGYCPECLTIDKRYSPLGWLRGHGDNYKTSIVYQPQEGSLPYALYCHNSGNEPVVLDRLDVKGANVDDSATDIFASTVTLFFDGCRNVVLQDLNIVAGNAASGFDGSSGIYQGTSGYPGGNGDSSIDTGFYSWCEAGANPATGDGGSSVCSFSIGRGGDGGASGKGSGTDGIAGITGSSGDNSVQGGSGGTPESVPTGLDGENGLPGDHGAGGQQGVVLDLASHFILPSESGENGQTGGCGAGGGGGAGGSGGSRYVKIPDDGCDGGVCPQPCSADSDCIISGHDQICHLTEYFCVYNPVCTMSGGAGAGGGSGASGGSPGSGGVGGGTSAAIYLWNSDIYINGVVTLKTGYAGAGGKCGLGALGGVGGAGGVGGVWPPEEAFSWEYYDGGSGGAGGKGGDGGNGGSGGGGAGGHSIGIISNSNFNTIITSDDAKLIYDYYDVVEGDRSGLGGDCVSGNSGSNGINTKCYMVNLQMNCE